jgi:hypothetical protein
MGGPPLSALTRLIAGAANLFSAEAQRAGAPATDLRRTAAALHSLPAVEPTRPPHRLPVCVYLDEALALADSTPSAPIASALAAVAPRLVWTRNPNYGDDPHLVANYGYAEIASPSGLITTDACAFGFLLLGPVTLSAAHAHPAMEFYYVVGGTARWWKQNNSWCAHPPGTLIHHPSGVAHAMHTDRQPLLALYTWLGDLATPSRLVPLER